MQKHTSFQFLKGAIKRAQCAEIITELQGFNSLKVRLKATFKSYSGWPGTCFNSLKVRLKAHQMGENMLLVQEFQFLKGAIKSKFALTLESHSSFISIP